MSRLLLAALAAVSFCFVAPTVKAEEGAKDVKEEVIEGVIESSDGEKAVFIIVVGEGEAAKKVEVKTTKDTAITLDGKAADAKALTKGAKAKVTHTAGTASKVDVTSAEAKK